MRGYKCVTMPVVAAALLATGCARQIKSTPPPPSCEVFGTAISDAPYVEAAQDAIREFLQCTVRSSSRPSLGIETEVVGAILDNPYPAVRRNAEKIVDRFFARGVLRVLPNSAEQLEAYLGVLSDQCLSARAQRDQELADAIAARRTRLGELHEMTSFILR